MGYSGARGTLIFEKNLMSKISWQTPFKLAGRCDSSVTNRFLAPIDYSKIPALENKFVH